MWFQYTHPTTRFQYNSYKILFLKKEIKANPAYNSKQYACFDALNIMTL